MSSLRLLRCAPLLLLAACGGGGGEDDGGGGGGPPPPTTFAVNLTGTVTYDFVGHFLNGALNYSGIVARPVRGATVELRAGTGSTACGSGALVASSVTSAAGAYSLSATTSGTLVVCVYAELQQTGSGATPGWEFLVVDNTRSKALYSIASSDVVVSAPVTATVNLHAASGWGGTGYTGTRAAAPFAILDVAYTALQKILSVDSDVQLPRLRLNWSVDNRPVNGSTSTGAIGTSYFNVENGSNEIYILGAANTDTDEYDDHVVAHEFGHYVEQVLSRSDSLGGPHGGDDRLDMRVAYGEGFGNAWSGIVFDDPRYTDSFGSGQGSGFFIEVETDTTTAPGWYNETSVQAFIYDAYDSTNESGDTVTLGLAPLYAIWTGVQRTTPALTSIFPLLDGLRDANAGTATALTALGAANAINGTDEWGAGETNSGGLGAAALPIYTSYTPGQGTIQLCTTNSQGEYNKLGNRRFLRLNISSAGNRTFAVSDTSGGSSDPDAVLMLAGTEVRRSEVVGNESFQAELAVGTYVLEVYPWDNQDGGSSGGAICLNVTIS